MGEQARGQGIPPISTTETILLECSRSNSLIDKNKIGSAGEQNASWINSTGNFRVKKGDQISVEMIALNLSQTTSPMEFTGENVVLEGAEIKPYVDNRVVLEIGYTLNNNQSYSCNLPIELGAAINGRSDPGLPPFPGSITRIEVMPQPNFALGVISRGIYPGIGMGFGCKYPLWTAGGVNQFQTPNAINDVVLQQEAHNASYRIAGFTGADYITPLANPTPAGVNIYSIILEYNNPNPALIIPPLPPIPDESALTSYKSFLHWRLETGNEGMFGKVGMYCTLENDILGIQTSRTRVCDIRSSTAAGGLVDPLRVQICFPQPNPADPTSGGFGNLLQGVTWGRAVCFTTPDIRPNDIYRTQGMQSWDNTLTSPNPIWSQNRQNSGITDFFSNGIQGTIPTGASGTIPLNAPLNMAFPGTPTGLNFLAGGGIGSANRQQGTDNLPYILTRNDYMNCRPKANNEKLGRYGTWCPDLQPLTSFIVLEASDLLMDATALAAKINDKLHANLPGVGDNTQDLRNYQTNIYGFTKRYKKSSQLLPFNQLNGYYPNDAYQQTDGVPFPNLGGFGKDIGGGGQQGNLSYENTQLWDTIDTYFEGGTKQVIPANLQPGWNKIAYIGYNSNITIQADHYALNRNKAGDAYPSFESTYLRTCKRPPDYFGDTCSWNNVFDGNKGVKDIYKMMWGDIFNKIPVWDGETPTHNEATSRGISRPVILNSQLQNAQLGGQLLIPSSYFDTITFDTTYLVKNQMIFTNVYYNKEALQATEWVGAKTTPLGDITNLLNRLPERQRDYEIYINTQNKTANTYEKQEDDFLGYALELDLGMTNDYLTTKWARLDTEKDSTPIDFLWASLNPAASAVPPYNSTPILPALPSQITPSTSSCWFGSGKPIPQTTPATPAGVERFDWNENQEVNRSVGRIWIQSRYDPNWLTTSNTGGENGEIYPNSQYPQLPVSIELDDTMCSFKNALGEMYADDTWSRENNMGIYPYKYTDENGGEHIFMAFRVAQDYKANNSQQINSEVTNTWRISQINWGTAFGVSYSAYDNNCIIPMNPDNKDSKTKEAIQVVAGVANPGIPICTALPQNANSYIAIGADNPTFAYDGTKSRMELTQTYKSTQLSPYNSTSSTGTTAPPDLPELGQKVAIFDDKCPDAVYSPPPAPAVPPVFPAVYNPNGGGFEKNQNQRSEETGIFIYKVWLPGENWSPPTDINLYSYWSNNSPDGQIFNLPLPEPLPLHPEPNYQVKLDGEEGYKYRDNQDGTENNRQEILDGLTEASPTNFRGSLLSKLGFIQQQFQPVQGRQWNRYSINGYNNPQPDLILTQNTKPFILNNQSNITLNPAFNINYIPSPVAPAVSGLPNYGLGFSNGQPVVTDSNDGILTAVNPIESTNSPFFQIYSTICPNNYLDNGTKKGILFYCMKNYQSGNYSYGYGSTFAHTATKDYNLDYIQTEIRNPITGRLMRVLQPNSVITYKVTRPMILAPDAYSPDGEPLQEGTDPLAEDVKIDTDEVFNIVPPAAGGGGGVAGGISLPPSAQGGVYYFGANNQVVNLDPPEVLEAEVEEMEALFPGEGEQVGEEPIPVPVGDEGDGEEVQAPFQEVVVEAGIIEEKIEELQQQGAEQAGMQQEDRDAPPQHVENPEEQSLLGDVNRGEMSSRVLLYDFLVHMTLNEMIPVNKKEFADEDKFAEALARAYENVQRFAVGYKYAGGDKNVLEDLAEQMDSGAISKEDGLEQLGNHFFDKVGGKGTANTRFMINKDGKRVEKRHKKTFTDQYFYAIHPAAAEEIARVLAEQKPPEEPAFGAGAGGSPRVVQGRKRLPPGAGFVHDKGQYTKYSRKSEFTERLEELIKERLNEQNIVLQENIESAGGIKVDTFIHTPGGVIKAGEQDYRFRRIPKEYYGFKEDNRSQRMGKISDATILGKSFNVPDYLKAEAGGLGAEYIEKTGGQVAPMQDRSQSRYAPPGGEENWAKSELDLGVGEKSKLNRKYESPVMLRALERVHGYRMQTAQHRYRDRASQAKEETHRRIEKGQKAEGYVAPTPPPKMRRGHSRGQEDDESKG